MMRVAYVCADAGVPVFGHKGCSVHVREMCRAMLEAGFDLTLFTARRGGSAAPPLSDVRVIDLPAPAASDPAAREREAIAANDRTRHLLASAGPFDLIYERASLWSIAPMMYAAGTPARGVIELNAPLVEEQSRYRTLVDRERAREMLGSALRTAHAVVAVSDEVAAGAHALTAGAANVHVVPNGVDVRRFLPVASRHSRPDRFIVGFVGTLKPWHGVSTLIDAFSRVARDMPAARLLIVGDGPERQNIERQAAARGLGDRMTITGPVPHDEVPGLLNQMDVAVAPYPALDGFYFSPLKILEYMAAGLPVVASAIGQVKALVRHGDTGWLFEPGDAAGLAEALLHLHDEPRLRTQLGYTARTYVAGQCTWQRVLDRVLRLPGVSLERAEAAVS